MLAALAFPPFKPPSLPNATAAGFFVGSGLAGSGLAGVLGFSPVASMSVRKADWLASSRLLDRLGIAKDTTRAAACKRGHYSD